jgi:uncharacterized membrane protein YdjX (TVP38/TMEM64 family)
MSGQPGADAALRPLGAGLRRQWHPGLRLALLALLLVGFTVLAGTVRLPELDRLRAWTTGFGALAPATFAAAYALAVPTPLPKSVLNAAAGLIFGIPVGVVVVVVGGTCGAVLSFLLARWLGRDAVAAMTRGQVERVDAAIERHGVFAALIVRFIPLLPFTMLNYACGVTAMRLGHYTLGTFLALVPGSSVWVIVGSLGGRVSPWLPAAVSVGLAVIMLMVSTVWWWRSSTARAPREGVDPAPGAVGEPVANDGTNRASTSTDVHGASRDPNTGTLSEEPGDHWA